MPKITTWLLAGAAFALSGGAAAAQDAAKQAEADAARAEKKIERRETRTERRHRGHDHDDAVLMRRSGHDRAERLRTLLQLRPEQEAALNAFLEATGREHGPARDHFVRFDRGDDDATTPERLARMEAKLAEQQAAMRRRIEATRAFYAQLDERQRKVFDAMPMLMMAGPGFGPMLLPIAHHKMFPPERLERPAPPTPPKAPARPRS